MAKGEWYKTAAWKLDIPLKDKKFTLQAEEITLNHHDFVISVTMKQFFSRCLPLVTLSCTSFTEDSSFSACKVKWRVTFVHPKDANNTISQYDCTNLKHTQQNSQTTLMNWYNGQRPGWLESESHCSLVVTVKLLAPLEKPKTELPELTFTEEWDHSDVVFNVEGYEVHAHRQILSVFSPVFQTMLYGDFKEKDTSKVQLPGKTHVDLVDFLRLLYPHAKSSDLDFQKALRLISWFHEYQVACLEDEAERLLMAGVTKETALQCLEIADRYDYEELKNAALAKAALLTSKEMYQKPQFLEFGDDMRSLVFEMRALHLEM